MFHRILLLLPFLVIGVILFIVQWQIVKKADEFDKSTMPQDRRESARLYRRARWIAWIGLLCIAAFVVPTLFFLGQGVWQAASRFLQQFL